MTLDHKSPVTGVTPEVSIVVPARNEEASLERCLRSLVEQQGTSFELLVIDDGSTDRTPEIIERFAGIGECPYLASNRFLVGVVTLQASAPPDGWTGKANAVWQAAGKAEGKWLLFTDADTVHEPGSLARAVAEAEQNGAVLLSYSPKQEAETLGERALLPLVFSELATRFRPREVRDPDSPVAAANGQYILIRRDVYFALGGHKAVAGELLEDVALAARVKKAGGKIHFRYGGEQVRTRMYRSWRQLAEGWTKNLVLLFPDARVLAWRRLSEFTVILLGLLVALTAFTGGQIVVALAAALVSIALLISFGFRLRRSHSGVINEALALFGLPAYAWLLLRSASAHERGEVAWKGRVYTASESRGKMGASHSVEPPSADATGHAATVVVISPTQERNGLPDPKV